MSSTPTPFEHDVKYLVDHELFRKDRAYLALFLCSYGRHQGADIVFINDRGETIFVPNEQCIAVEPDEYSQSWPTAYRGRRSGLSSTEEEES